MGRLVAGKIAIIQGGGGGPGARVARTFGREGITGTMTNVTSRLVLR